ncbi:MAG: hypothetical protein J6V72_01395 [Kiritimatiellae bacterium]|nr:hypothetical protein [Kiritimatiellia bacterium]
MRGRVQNVVLLVLVAVLVGGGYYYTRQADGLRKELRNKQDKLDKLLELNQGARDNAAAAEAEKEKARSEAKKAEAERAKSENARKTAESNAAAKKQEQENIEAKRKLAKEEAVRAEKAAAAAAAEQKRLEAEKAASEAKAKELAVQRAKDELTLKTAAELRAKADADAARALAEQKKAELDKEKSGNEVKAAELLAAARRDERMLMYKRGGVSEAERNEVQRAEKMLKLWESGMLTPENLAAANRIPSAEELAQPAPEKEEDPAIAEEKKKLAEKEVPPPPPDPKDEKIKELGLARDKRLVDERRRVSEDIAARIEPLLRAAEKGGRTRDVAYYRSVLQSLIPEYGAASDAPKPEK